MKSPRRCSALMSSLCIALRPPSFILVFDPSKLMQQRQLMTMAGVLFILIKQFADFNNGFVAHRVDLLEILINECWICQSFGVLGGGQVCLHFEDSHNQRRVMNLVSYFLQFYNYSLLLFPLPTFSSA